MQRQLVAAGAPGLADPVGRHEAALVDAGPGAQPEELHVPGIELASQRAAFGIHRVDQPALAAASASSSSRQLALFPDAERLETSAAHGPVDPPGARATPDVHASKYSSTNGNAKQEHSNEKTHYGREIITAHGMSFLDLRSSKRAVGTGVAPLARRLAQ